VNRQWRRIEAWLKTNAPRSHRTLGKPGKAETIAAAEARMGLPFPDDLRASLLRHDGTVFVKDTWGFGFLGSFEPDCRGDPRRMARPVRDRR
jgi:cell wall assembly regulator SMI1